MKNLPTILRHNTILTNWSGYPVGSLERAKALGIEVFSRSNSLEATIDLWRTECDLVEKEKPWLPLGLKNKEQYILAVTGKTEKAIQRKISKTQAIRQRRDKYPDETLQETANEIGVSRQFVYKVLSTKASDSEVSVDRPEWIKSNNEKSAFNKLSKSDQDKVRKAGKGSLRGIAIAAGVVKVQTVLEQLRRLWNKATPTERHEFLSDIQEATCP
jgi:hypothetical protein